MTKNEYKKWKAKTYRDVKRARPEWSQERLKQYINKVEKHIIEKGLISKDCLISRIT